MPHYKTLIDTNCLGQWDFPAGGKATVVIRSADRYTPQRKQRKKCEECHGTGTFLQKPCATCSGSKFVDVPNKKIKLTFQGKRKYWLAGPVNQAIIAGMYGDMTEGWIGKKITLHVDSSVTFGTKKTGGVRVLPTRPRDDAPVSEDPLDRPVDEDKAREIDEAAGRVAG